MSGNKVGPGITVGARNGDCESRLPEVKPGPAQLFAIFLRQIVLRHHRCDQFRGAGLILVSSDERVGPEEPLRGWKTRHAEKAANEPERGRLLHAAKRI